MRKKEMTEKLKDLEQYIENVSTIQGQLLKELGYATRWEPFPVKSTTPNLVKLDDENILSNEDRHDLFEIAEN